VFLLRVTSLSWLFLTRLLLLNLPFVLEVLKEGVDFVVVMILSLWEDYSRCLDLFFNGSSLGWGTFATLCRRSLSSLSALSSSCCIFLVLLSDSLTLLIYDDELFFGEFFTSSLLLLKQELLSRHFSLLSSTRLICLPLSFQGFLAILFVCVFNKCKGLTAVELNLPGDFG